MNVIVLAGGYAERLWPLTENFPKTMLKVAGKPVLYFLLENISKLQGISSITIAVDKDKKTYFESAIDDINVYSTIRPKLSVHELNQDGTVIGPMRKISQILKNKDSKLTDDDFLLIGGDNVFCFELNKVVSFYREKLINCIAIQKHIKPVDSSSFGIPNIDESGRVKGLDEKPESTAIKLISTACYCLTKETLEHLSDYKGKDNLGTFIDWLSQKTDMIAYQFDEKWYDIGTREGLLCANANLYKTKYASTQLPSIIRKSTHLFEPIYSEKSSLINDSNIGPNVYIGLNCTIINSNIKNSIIYDGCVLRNCNVVDSIVGQDSIVEGNISESVFGPNTKLLGESKKEWT